MLDIQLILMTLIITTLVKQLTNRQRLFVLANNPTSVHLTYSQVYIKTTIAITLEVLWQARMIHKSFLTLKSSKLYYIDF